MLKKLIIRNFQCHKRLTLEFDSGVTTIVGPGDIGKSAILRALRWVCLNQPTGSEFITHGKKQSTVKLVVSGTKGLRRRLITRRKGNGSNSFKIDGSAYKAFGAKIPSAVHSLLNITEENFQDQFSAPFWFWLTPGQVSKELNRIVNLESIDKTLASIAQASRSARARTTVVKERLSKAREAKKSLRWSYQADSRLKAIETAEKELAHNRNRNAALASLIIEASEQATRIENAQERLSVAQSTMQRIEAGYIAWMEAKATTLIVSNWVKHLTEAKEEQWQAKEEIKRLKSQLSKLKTCPTCGQVLPRS